MVFAHMKVEKSYTEASKLFRDGTFQSCSIQFKQLYTIHIDLPNSEEDETKFPEIYTLLQNKTEKHTQYFFFLLIDHFPPLLISILGD